MKNIKLGGQTIPLIDYAVGAAAILGIRDSGKTVTAKGIAEQLIENGVPVVVFDAVGKWRFLKLESPEGGKSYKVVVVGGRDPDLPLNPHSVVEVIRAALKERIPIIVDLFDPQLSKKDWKSIVKSAVKTIHYENDGSPIHIFLEEAAEFVPQKIIDFDVYAEIEKCARMGGNNGVGITLINQRSQELNKAVLEQCTTLILGQQIGNKAIEAIGKWVERLDSEIENAVLHSLPKLKAGQAWVWTRQSPDKPLLNQFPMCRSYHPDRRTQTKAIKELGYKTSDISGFISQMSAAIPKVIEQAKSNDPAELRKEITRLNRELLKAMPVVKTETKEVSVLTDADRKMITRAEDYCVEVMTAMEKETAKIVDAIRDMRQFFEKIRAKIPATIPWKQIPPGLEKRYQMAQPVTKPVTHENANGETIAGGARRMLIALAQRPQGLNDKQIGVRAGMSSKSGTFGTYLGRLRSLNYIDGERSHITITEDGIRALGDYRPLPTGKDLMLYWLEYLGQSGAGRMLAVLAEKYPDTVTADELGQLADMESSSGTFGTYLGKLRTLELIEGKRDALKASDELFE